MRSNKTIFGLLLLLVLFVLIKVGLNFTGNKSTDLDIYKSWWSSLSSESVSGITLTKSADTISLSKQNGTWTVNNEYQAESTAISEWLAKLINPDSVEVVSESIASFERLGIASTSAQLSIKANSLDKQITIGNSAAGGRYVKLHGKDIIYLIKDLPPTLDSVSVFDWMDKAIVKIDQSSIKKITWTHGKQVFSIEKKDSDWLSADGKKLDTTNITEIINNLASLPVTEFASAVQLKELPKDSTFTLTVERNGQDTVTLQFFETKNFKAITASTIKGTFIVSDSVYTSFNLKPTDLKFKP